MPPFFLPEGLARTESGVPASRPRYECINRFLTFANQLDRLSAGNYADAKSVGGGICEIRIHYGPGYRVHFVHRGRFICVLLGGGTKSTQQADIVRAKALAEELGASL